MDPVGMMAVGLVAVAGTGIGLWRRRTDGHLRPVGGRTAGNSGATVAAAGGAPATGGVVEGAGGVVEGTVLPGTRREQTGGVGDTERLDAALLERLGVEPGRVTMLQFSTAFCAPCRAVRRVSAEVAELLPETRHVEVDAESHLDEVRALNIWRTPTLLIIDGGGRVTRRATGVPTKPHLIAALAPLL
jgi:thiol-disulfide isomerase/thioredoxin